MKKLCVIGDPIDHSKSPLIQNAMLTALGLSYEYGRQLVHPGETADFLARAKAEGYAGFNATMPHKEALVPLMDELDEDARRCGAVNTVCLRAGRVYGYNTDGTGFLRALGSLGLSPAGLRVTVLGAGGAAKSVSLALARSGAKVTVCNRTLDKAAALCGADPDHMTPANFALDTLCKLSETTDLLFNGTSLGMSGTAGQFTDLSFVDALPKTAAVCDAIYAPPETALLARAKALGHPTMNGLPMLLGQAVLALKQFTQTDFDEKTAEEAARKALEGEKVSK